jgi:hypothetical protein
MTPFEKVSVLVFLAGCAVSMSFEFIRGSREGLGAVKIIRAAAPYIGMAIVCIAAVRVGWRWREDDVQSIQKFLTWVADHQSN